MRYSSFFLVSLSFILSAGRLTAQQSAADSIGATLTLHQAVDIAIRNNLLVNQSDINAQSSKIALDQSWEYMLPTFSANGGQQINFGRTISSTNNQYINSQYSSGSLGINAGLVIFHGLEYQNNIKEQRYAFNAGKLDLQQQKDNITLNVLLAYLQILSNRDQLELARDQAVADSGQLARLEEQNKQGALVPVSNLTDLQGQYAGDMVNITAAINNLEQSKVALFGYLNVPYKRDVEYQNSVTTSDISEYPASSDSIFTHAMQIIPSIKSAQLKVYEYQKALAVTRGQYWPTLSFGGGISTNWTNTPNPSSNVITDSLFSASGSQFANSNGSSPIYNKEYLGYNVYPKFGEQFKNDRGEYFGLNVSIPILNGFQARNNVRNAKLTLRNFEFQNIAARNQLQQTIEMQFQNMIAAYKQFKFYQEQAAAYKESFRITDIRFSNGVVTSDVYLQAKGRSDQAETNLSAARYIYIFRTKVLDYYEGKLAIP